MKLFSEQGTEMKMHIFFSRPNLRATLSFSRALIRSGGLSLSGVFSVLTKITPLSSQVKYNCPSKGGSIVTIHALSVGFGGSWSQVLRLVYTGDVSVVFF